MAKILIIDDEEPILTMYSDPLKEGGYEVITAATGEEGIIKAQKEKPDIILLDIMMPKVNGLDALGELRADAETKNIPIFLLTNLPEDSAGGKPRELGISGYLVKAEVEPNKLLEIINDTLKK